MGKSSGVSREDFANKPGPVGRLVLPCGPQYGCDFEDCEGWVAVRDDPFDLRLWSPEEIAAAQAFGPTGPLRAGASVKVKSGPATLWSGTVTEPRP